MGERLRPDEVAPHALKGLLELEKYVRGAVDGALLELIALRVSGQLESAAARDDRERALLALTDAVTNLGADGVPDDVWREGAKHWSEKELADLTMAIVAAKGWSRIEAAVGSGWRIGRSRRTPRLPM